ncbi:hypothetical protein [Nocardioides sp.]|uniref:hypothetical protein n=1 Tax=Nocardioides sp. TaxID=35761 RepID=UPI002BD1AA68|nr:hypothetical protein [Nocardioides sp.]HXH79193.1 hypothetical protein [Nocardioides sp.]
MKFLAAVAVTVTLALTSSAASASTSRIPDAAGDVWVIVDSGVTAEQPTDHVTNVDLLGVRVETGPRALTVRVSFVELVRNDDRIHLRTTFRTDRQMHRVVQFGIWPRKPRGTAVISRLHRRNVSCSGLVATIDRVADVVRLVVPLSCLDRPRWVQHKTLATTIRDHEWFLDAAGSATARPAGWSARLITG